MRAQLVQQTYLESLFHTGWTELELGKMFVIRDNVHIHLLQLWEALGVRSFVPGCSSSPGLPFPLSLSQCSPLCPKTGTHSVITASNQPQIDPVTAFTQPQTKALICLFVCLFVECLYGFIT